MIATIRLRSALALFLVASFAAPAHAHSHDHVAARVADDVPAATAKPALAPADALALIEGDAPPQVLDVRSADEFAQGHVPRAVLIPHDELEARLGELDRTRPVLVYCRSGRRSTLAETILLREGFDVRQIDGSWLRWQAESRPVASPPGTAPVENPAASD